MPERLSEELEQFRRRVDRDSSALLEAREWALLNGNRALIAALICLAVFLFLFGLRATGAVAFDDGSAITRLSSGIVSGEFSLLTIVLTINQLILSQETGPPDQIQERLDGMMDFRQRYEGAVGVDTTPAEPVAMLEVLADRTCEEIDRLGETVDDVSDAELRETFETYCEATEESIGELQASLADSSTGAFEALSSAIAENYGWEAHLARRIEAERGDELPDAARNRLSSIVTLMEVFSIARAHFKTIYIRRELGVVSRRVLVVGIPALVSGVVLNAIYGSSLGVTVPPTLLPLVVVSLLTVSVAPVALLASYILRTATVARRTANIGPMALQRGR